MTLSRKQELFPPETVCSHWKHCKAEGLLSGRARACLHCTRLGLERLHKDITGKAAVLGADSQQWTLQCLEGNTSVCLPHRSLADTKRKITFSSNCLRDCVCFNTENNFPVERWREVTEHSAHPPGNGNSADIPETRAVFWFPKACGLSLGPRAHSSQTLYSWAPPQPKATTLTAAGSGDSTIWKVSLEDTAPCAPLSVRGLYDTVGVQKPLSHGRVPTALINERHVVGNISPKV